MRALPFLLCLAAVAAGEDLRPRAGSGWAGFKPGTWVSIRRTAAIPGKEPLVTNWTSRLVQVGRADLTLEMKVKTGIGLEQKTATKVPLRGEAGAGETQRVERLGAATVKAAGRSFECARVRTTVTGPQGKRVVTDWTARDPALRVKRTIVTYGPDGKPVSRQTMLLDQTDVKRAIGDQTLRCVKYKVRRRQGKQEETGTVVSSRDVPGDTVFLESVTRENGKPVLAMRLEAVAFEAK